MCLRPVNLKFVGQVPCGKCLECRMQRAEEWSARMVIEAESCGYEAQFITLTYNDANLPTAGVKVKEIQDFLKRFRKSIAPAKVRYFACGEYGSTTHRAHYHLVIFGYRFSDLTFLKNDNKGTALYTSALLLKLWKKGFHSIAEFSPEVAKYCAKYIVADRPGCNKSFVTMSKKPILGYAGCKPEILERDRIYYAGRNRRVPRAFLKVLEKKYPEQVALLKQKRKERARLYLEEYLNAVYKEYSKYSILSTVDSHGVLHAEQMANKLAAMYRDIYYKFFLSKKQKLLDMDKKFCYAVRNQS